MLPSHINKLAEAYAQIAEGKKSEEEVKDWNRKDDNPEGKKVDKKKVDKCTCESFYLKRLQAMNPVYAEQYLAIAEMLIGEGYESARLMDNIIEALPREVVGHEFRAALEAVNGRIYENLHTAEKKQARAIVEQIRVKSPQEWWKGIKSIPGNLQKTWQQFAPPPERSADPNVRAGRSYTGPSGTPVTPYARVRPSTPAAAPAAGSGSTPPAQPAARPPAQPAPQPARTPVATGSGSAARVTPPPAKPFVAQTGDKAKDEATWEKANPRLAQAQKLRKSGASRAEINKVLYNKGTAANTYTPSVVKSSYEPEGEIIDENLVDKAKKGIKTVAKYGGLGLAGAALNKLHDDGKISLKDVKKDFANSADIAYGTPARAAKKYLQNNSYELEGELLEYTEGGGGGTVSAPPGVAKFVDELPGRVSATIKRITSGDKAKVKPTRTTKEEVQMEGIRDTDSEKGTEERKERLEKKRGMKVDDHPQYKKEKDDDSYLETNMKKRHENNEKARKEMAAHKDDTVPRWMRDDFNLYDVILTYLDENGLMDSVEHAEAIMEQLTAEQIQSIVEEILSEEPVQDYRDRRRAAENKGGARGPELSHGPDTKAKPTPPTASSTAKIKPTNTNRPNSSVSSPGSDTRRIGGYDLRRLSK